MPTTRTSSSSASTLSARPSPAPGTGSSSSSSATSVSTAVDDTSKRHLRRRRSSVPPPSSSHDDDDDDEQSDSSTSTSMPRSKYPPERLPTSDPYEEEETGFLKHHQQQREPEMGFVRRVVSRGGWQRSGMVVVAILLSIYALFGGFSGGKTEVIVQVTPGASGVGGQALNLDAEGRPVAPALDQHDFNEDTKQVTPISINDPAGSELGTPAPVKAECVVPEGKPEHQYALMVDAGSTGSRIHVYKFSYCSPVPVETTTFDGQSQRRPSKQNSRDEETVEESKKLRKRVKRGLWGSSKQSKVEAVEAAEEKAAIEEEVAATSEDPASSDKFLKAAKEPSSYPKAKAGPLPILEDELFFKVQPGLSSFAGRPRDAAESLRPLLEEAVKGVPKSLHKCTPIAVKATAGLRLLGAEQSQEILDEVESWLKRKWPFPLIDDGVKIMDGSDEGVYAWVTINYLLHLIGPTSADNATAAVMDLGGASTQIVFEPTFVDPSAKLEPGDHVYELNFASQTHPLYQHSHLGYGLMQGRRSVHNFVAFAWLWQSQPKGQALEWANLTEEVEVPNPCLVKDGRKLVTLDPPGREKVNVTFVGTGAGFEACRRVVDVIMAKDALCPVEPCAFGGVYQPKLMETFSKGPIYALSYFYDRIAPLGLESPFKMSDLRQLTTDVCAGPKGSAWSRFKSSKEAMDELDDRPEYCLDLSFLYSLLSFGYELAEDREIIISKKIDGVELGWSLGAAIAMLDMEVKCKA